MLDEGSNTIRWWVPTNEPVLQLIISPTLRHTRPRVNPWPQCAFENQVFGVSCNSHRLSELAPFFIDLRAEWSTVCSCTAFLSYLCHKEVSDTSIKVNITWLHGLDTLLILVYLDILKSNPFFTRIVNKWNMTKPKFRGITRHKTLKVQGSNRF